MAEVGFLGMGNMGRAMAGRLLEHGHEVLVWNRNPDACDELVGRGAQRAASAREALAAPVSFSMFANDDASEAVLSVEDLEGAPGRLHVNAASISPAAADRIAATHAKSGVGYLA